MPHLLKISSWFICALLSPPFLYMHCIVGVRWRHTGDSVRIVVGTMPADYSGVVYIIAVLLLTGFWVHCWDWVTFCLSLSLRWSLFFLYLKDNAGWLVDCLGILNCRTLWMDKVCILYGYMTTRDIFMNLKFMSRVYTFLYNFSVRVCKFTSL